MKGFSLLCLVFAIDAVWALADGDNMYTLKPGGGVGVAVNVVTLAACLLLGPLSWRVATRP